MNGQIPDILRKYFESWQSRDVAEVLRLFRDDATYEIVGRFGLRGRDELEQYWQRVADTQYGLEWKVIESMGVENELFATWQAEFVRKDLDVAVQLNGIIWISLRGGKIYRFRECYRKDEL